MKNLNYFHVVLQIVSRILSLVDRNPHSPTFGCFDRNFWHYRLVTDFPSAPYQQSVLFLTLLYLYKHPENPHHNSSEILRLIEAGIKFWTEIQHKDGSFDEWYPNEHSFVATSFTTYAITESLLLLGSQQLKPEIMKAATEAIKKAGHWLAENHDIWVANHTAGAVASLKNISLILKDNFFEEAYCKKLDELQSFQDEEGWFSEYKGADPGYTGVSVDFLAKCYKRSKDEKILSMIKRALDFMSYFLHPDGSFGGEYGSRNTKYLLPHGLELMSQELPAASHLLQPFYAQDSLENLVNPLIVDDRYLTFFFAPNYLYAAIDQNPQNSNPTVYLPEEYEKYFPNAGLFIKKNSKFYTVINVKKGGVMKIFSKNKNGWSLMFDDCGYFSRLKNGKIATTQWLNLDTKAFVTTSSTKTEIKLKTNFVLVDTTSYGKLLFPFRLVNNTLCKISLFADYLGNLIKRTKILKKVVLPVELKREIIISNSEIIIKDNIETNGVAISDIFLGKASTALFVPSSRFFVKNELEGLQVEMENLKEELKRKGKAEIEISYKKNNIWAKLNKEKE